MLLGAFVICFFAFCLTVIITSNLKPKTTVEKGIAKAEPLCSVDPDLADFEASLSGKPKSKRYAGKKGSWHVRKSKRYAGKKGSQHVRIRKNGGWNK